MSKSSASTVDFISLVTVSTSSLYTNGSFTDNIKLYKHVGYRVDREEVHPQFGATVYMSKHLLPGLTASPD